MPRPGAAASLGSIAYLVILLASALQTTAQLTPEQHLIKEQAYILASELLYGDGRAGVSSTDDGSFLTLVAARQEHYLNKQAAVRAWSGDLNSTSSRRLVAAAEQLQEGVVDGGRRSLKVGSSVSFSVARKRPPPKRKSPPLKRKSPPPRRNSPPPRARSPPPKPKVVRSPPPRPPPRVRSPPPPPPLLSPPGSGVDVNFNPSTGCSVQMGTTYDGGNLTDGYIAAALSWTECCSLCYTRADCFAWTFKPGSAQPGCHLKGRVGYTLLNLYKGHVSGVMTSAFTRPPAPEGTVPAPLDPLAPSPAPIEGGALLPPPPPPPNPALLIPPSPPPPPPFPNSLPAGKAKYGEVLGLSWKYYEAQRSGPTPSWNRIDWRSDSHLTDKVVGGWYDAGDFLKLNFPLAPTVSMLAWGMLEFKSGYTEASALTSGKRNIRIAADYLAGCYNAGAHTYVGQIGDPDVDHDYWGRPEQQKTTREAFVYDKSMPAADLLGGVAAALASTAVLFKNEDPGYAAGLVATAEALYKWGASAPGKYSDFYKKQTASIYRSSDYLDSLAWAAGWLYQATGDAAYLDKAAQHWGKGSSDVYPGWDSLWAQHAFSMYNLAKTGVVVPNIAAYSDYVEHKFMKAWLGQNGFMEIIKTPKGLAYPSWNEWANLQFSTTAAFLALVKARHNPDAVSRAAEIGFARTQVDYSMGSAGRSFIVGYGKNFPLFPHHAAASCPDMPSPCGEKQFASKDPNPQVLYGALVGGPRGVRASKSNPDDTYTDKRSDYVSNEVANDYNAGLTGATAGLLQLL